MIEIGRRSLFEGDDRSLSNETRGCRFCRIIKGVDPLFMNNDFVGPHLGPPYTTDTFVVFPDGAPLTPVHVLITPVEHTLSLARMNRSSRSEILAGIHRVRSILEERDPGRSAFYFEHGSCEEDEQTGCSTTHGHFHVVIAPDDLLADCEATEDFESVQTIPDAWDRVNRSDYYMFGRFDGPTYVHEIAEHSSLKCHMYLRKLFASQLGAQDLADYRRYTGEDRTPDPLVNKPEELYHYLQQVTSSRIQLVGEAEH